jgi:hypothetical protein
MRERNRADPPRVSAKALDTSLWITQVLLFLIFAGGAAWKVITPLHEIAEMMAWAGEVPKSIFYGTAMFDLLGGLGLLLPAITRVRPELTALAALGCAFLMVAAIIFHLSRGDASDTPFNFLLLALCSFVFWGRKFRAPISSSR